MKKLSKRLKNIQSFVLQKDYSLSEAINVLKQTSTAKFIESAEAHFCLNIDTKYNDQQLRTTIQLPNGTGKEISIAVFTSDNVDHQLLLDNGANQVGSDALLEKIKNGALDFDVLLTTPDMMPKLLKVGKILGPRGLMPSTKSGTITTDILATLAEFKTGKVECRADKTGVVHILFGKMNFTESELIENLSTAYECIKQNRPTGVKGKYFKTFTVCTTMGPSINIDLSKLK